MAAHAKTGSAGFCHARDPSGQVLLPTFATVSIAWRSRLPLSFRKIFCEARLVPNVQRRTLRLHGLRQTALFHQHLQAGRPTSVTSRRGPVRWPGRRGGLGNCRPARASRQPQFAPAASAFVAAAGAPPCGRRRGGPRGLDAAWSPASSGDLRLWRKVSPSRSVARLRARAVEIDLRRRTFAGGLWPPTLKRVLHGFSTRAILHGKCFCQRLLQSQSRGGTHLHIRSEDSYVSWVSA